MICNATKQELVTAGLSILANCTVDGCGFPVARHRDATQPGNHHHHHHHHHHITIPFTYTKYSLTY
jgi:hypothetical protein